MGPKRGMLLDKFWSLDMHGRACQLKDARRGGSVPPEYLEELFHQESTNPRIDGIHEETQISHVEYDNDELVVTFDNIWPPQAFDMIWLCTGSDNDVDLYPILSNLRQDENLPIDVVQGLPVLANDLSWKKPDGLQEEPMWKQTLRRRLWCMGVLSGLTLGPDALNLVGARHGAVRVATAIRSDMDESTK